MRRSVLVAWLALLVLAGLFLRADRLGLRSFSHDEVLHVLAAKSLAATGAPTLPSGEPYLRALPITRAVALAFEYLGESEASARVPSVVAGVLTIPAVFLLGTALFGPTAGLVAAALLAFSPDAVAMSRFVRMYAWAQLLVVLASAAYARGLLAARPLARAGWLAAGVGLTLLTARIHAETYLLLAPLALHLGIVTAWHAATGGLPAVRRAPETRVLAAGAAAAALVLLLAPGRVLATLETGLTRLPWFPAEAWDPKFYHLYLAETYDYLWFLAPAATLAAVVTRPRAGLNAALLFWAPFLLLSAVVPTQSERYLFVFLPGLFVLLGEGGRLGARLVHARLAANLSARLPWPALARPLATALVVATLLVVVRASPWFAAAQANRLKAHGQFAGAAFAQWREAAAWAQRHGFADAAVVSPADHVAFYYFGRVDGRLLHGNQGPHAADRDVEVTPHGVRFRSYTTGAAAFAGVEDLASLVERHARGLVLLERYRLLPYPPSFAPGVTAYLARRLEEADTPAAESLAVLTWDTLRRADVGTASAP